MVDWVLAVEKENAGSQEAGFDDIEYQENRDKVLG